MTSAVKHARLLVEQTGRLLGTEVRLPLAVAPGEEARARAAIGACLAWLREVERRLTRFQAESDLSQLNARAGRWWAVSAVRFTAVSGALAAALASAGRLDPAVLPHREALGSDRDVSWRARQPRAADQGAPPVALPRGRWRAIQLDRKRRRIRLPPGARLDGGGIATGWAAVRALKRRLGAFAQVLVNLGGARRLRAGPRPGEPWAVGLSDRQDALRPGTTPPRATVTLARGGLATSGATRHWWYPGDARRQHLLDPRTGRVASRWIPAAAAGPAQPAARRLMAAATALAPTAARAEVAARVALLRGYPEALHAVEAPWRSTSARGPRLPTDRGVALLLIRGSGAVIPSAHLEPYRQTCAGGGMLWVLPAQS